MDRKHWNKFSSFSNYSKTFNDDRFDYEHLENSDHVFMRWKVSKWGFGAQSFRQGEDSFIITFIHYQKGAVPCSGLHDQGYNGCLICRILLYLFSEVNFNNWGLLLSSVFWMVRASCFKIKIVNCCEYSDLIWNKFYFRYQSLSLNHIQENSSSAYEFR